MPRDSYTPRLHQISPHKPQTQICHLTQLSAGLEMGHVKAAQDIEVVVTAVKEEREEGNVEG